MCQSAYWLGPYNTQTHIIFNWHIYGPLFLENLMLSVLLCNDKFVSILKHPIWAYFLHLVIF